MNQADLKEQNRKKVLSCLQRARTNPSGGLKAHVVAKRANLCLRTVQTHLRALRDEGAVYNHRGLWQALDL